MFADCNLEIVVDRADRSYRPGEVVSGKVIAGVTRECRCDGLSVTLQWRTHGKGNTDKGPDDNRQAFGSFDWTPGTHEHRFELTMPDGPVSYHGTIVNVDFYLCARADVPWAVDPKAELDLLLQPWPPDAVAAPGYRDERRLEPWRHTLGLPKDHKAFKAPAGCMVVVALFVLGFLAFWAHSMMRAGGPWWAAFVFLGLIVAGFARGIARWVGNRLARGRLGDVTVSIEPDVTLAGGELRVGFELCPIEPVELDALTAELTGTEIAVSGSGSRKTTHRHSLHQAVTVACDERQTLAAGARVSLSTVLHVPADAAPTFRGGNNQVKWQIETRVDLHRWPDLCESHEITVQPS